MFLLALLPTASISCAASPESNRNVAATKKVVLVLVDELTWGQVQETPSLAKISDGGAVANLSTSQGTSPADPRMGYVLLGAGSRADTSQLPDSLPADPANIRDVFDGPAASILPGSFGEALSRAGLQVAAVGEKPRLAVMDRTGKVPRTYDPTEPSRSLEKALAEDADFVAVQARGARQAGRLAEASRRAGARVALASPDAPAGSANLTPFLLGVQNESLLFSPTTRTKALMTNTDVAPTLLAQLGVDPQPEMQGRPATVRPGTAEAAERLRERLAFVAEKRTEVWLLAGAALILGLLVNVLRKGRKGAGFVLLSLSALPAGALIVSVLPTTNVLLIVIFILIFGGSLAGFSWRFSGSLTGAISAVYLTTAVLILADTVSGGTLMKFSMLGYNPVYGTRFYGIGNEYAAFLAGGLTMGLGALAHRRRLPLALMLIVGFAAVIILGLPTMGADVGGSLALGLGFGATVGLLRGAGLRGLAFWTAVGLVPAAGLFLTSGLLFPGVSHGSRTAGGETGLSDIIVRKLLLSLDLLLSPVFLPVLAAGLVVVLLAWRRTRATAFGAGLMGATITALASGALNDSGILAAIYALAYPAVAAGIFLLSEPARLRISSRASSIDRTHS